MPKQISGWACNICHITRDNNLEAEMCELRHRCSEALSTIINRSKTLYPNADLSRLAEIPIGMTNFVEKLEKIAKELLETNLHA